MERLGPYGIKNHRRGRQLIPLHREGRDALPGLTGRPTCRLKAAPAPNVEVSVQIVKYGVRRSEMSIKLTAYLFSKSVDSLMFGIFGNHRETVRGLPFPIKRAYPVLGINTPPEQPRTTHALFLQTLE